VESVPSSPDQGLVVVHGTADAWVLKRRIWRKIKRRAHIVNDGSTPYYGPSPTTPAPHYGSSQSYGYYNQQPPPPPHGYYSHPPPPPGYHYAARGYDGWAADQDPYGYAAHDSVPMCSIQ
jgi:hypothetical protein